MRKLEINEQLFLVPEKWQECTTEQVVELLPLSLFKADGSGLEIEIGLKKRALKLLLPIDINALFQKTDYKQANRLLSLTDWIFIQKIEHKPFMYFELDGTKYYLPNDNFSNTTAIELAMTNIYLLQYSHPKKPRPEAVFELLGILCRPKRKDLDTFRKSNDWSGDIREEYNSVLSEERAKKFKKLKLGYIIAILQYYVHMNTIFNNSYKDVYDDDQDETPLYNNGMGILTTLMDIAKLQVFGVFDNVCKQNAHTVWLFLRDHSMKIKRQIAEQEKLLED